MSTKFWQRTRGAQEIQGYFCLGKELIPEMHGKGGVDTAKPGDEVVFKSANCSFRGVSTVDIGGRKLKIDALIAKISFKVCGGFIIQAMEFWNASGVAKSLEKVLVSFYYFRTRPIF